jgi:periplasmic protein TonB
MMSAAVPGIAKLTERALLLVGIASLHALIIYLLSSGSQAGYDSLGPSIIEAELIPFDRRPPKPPTLPEIEFQVHGPIRPTLLQVAIDVPSDPAPAPAAMDTVLSNDDQPGAPASMPSDVMPSDVDTIPVLRPRPISGPSGADRYPNESLHARESGTVMMNICVSSNGTVDRVELTGSSGFPRLDKVALGMASEYRFQPAMRAGRAVAACAWYWIVFKVI